MRAPTQTFSEEDLEKFHQERSAVFGKYFGLLTSYSQRTYKNKSADEFAKHGFLRRIKTLVRCIDNVFGIVPPDRADIPTADDLSDVTINLQSFVFNVFGSVDNLAWIWVFEKGLTKENGSPISKNLVGLGPKNELIRRSFSIEFQRYIKQLDDWFAFLENFRHALAHRIPLYVPPHIVSKSNEEAYLNLEAQISSSIARGDFEEHDRLASEQIALAAFKPWMTHSFGEEAKIVVFHAQLLADFNTVVQIGEKIILELATDKQ